MSLCARFVRPLAAALLVWGAPVSMAAPVAVCEARSGTMAPRVVELYTSEGCSSCPPADRWLSTLQGRQGVIALAFHVDYWDRLGWQDRFADARYSERQYAWQRASGARFVYTPQVLVDGRDWRGWPGALPAPAATAAPAVTLVREGATVTATIAALPAPAGALSGYWAITENGHETRVRAGENSGRTLRHDAVVRRYAPVAAWPGERAHTLRWTLPDAVAMPGRQVVFVLTRSGVPQPLQAVALGC